MMKTSLQTITWGDPQHHLFDHIFGIAAELSVELEKLRAIALGCAEHDIKLLYHNHDWEFRGNRRIWDRLQSAEIEGLGYALDLGWAIKGGQDMAAQLCALSLPLWKRSKHKRL
jgi:sugar phosphate isomerase/epimerase